MAPGTPISDNINANGTVKQANNTPNDIASGYRGIVFLPLTLRFQIMDLEVSTAGARMTIPV